MKKTITTIALSLFAVLQVNAQTIRYVKPGGTGDGSSWATASGDVQAVITASVANDKVWVAAGTYQPILSGSSFSLKDGVAVYGGFAEGGNMGDRNPNLNQSLLKGNNATVIDNGVNSLSNSAILDGFTITEGSSATKGGGMFNESSSPTISNCVFSNNSTAGLGGGMYNRFSSPIIFNCTFSNNTSGSNGGGIANFVSSAKVSTSTFSLNKGDAGGAIYNTGYCDPVFEYCKILNNQASAGGGIANEPENSVVLFGCIIAGNHAFVQGGGIYNAANVVNTVISGNIAATGGGIFNTGNSSVIINSTIAGNSGAGGIQNSAGSNASISNSIIYGNSGGIENSSSTPVISNCIVQGDNQDPKFLSSPSFSLAPFTNGDYSILVNSAAIDAGNSSLYTGNAIANANHFDVSGRPRFSSGGTIDIGAYAYQPILPVLLQSYNVKLNGGIVKIDWRTVTENNNEEFIVSRSEDGVTFIEFQRVKGAGNSNAISNYNIYDYSPLVGTSYYKLQQADRDGKLTELGIRFVNAGALFQSVVYPNPTYGDTKVLIQEGAYTKVFLLTTGGEVLQENVIPSSVQELDVSLSIYPAGIYILKLTGAKETRQIKISKY